MMMKGLTILFCIMFCQFSYSQNVGINDDGLGPDASAGLDVRFTNKGFLTPRLTLAQKTTLTATAIAGLLIYQTDGVAGFYYYTGSGWTLLASNAALTGWSTIGNNGTIAANNFVGTIDAIDLVFRAANTERMRIASGGNISFAGLGTGSSTDYMMSINNTSNVVRKIQPTSSSSPFWAIGGNAIATSAKNFGTTTTFDLPFITDGVERMRIMADGTIGIGSTNFYDGEKVLIDGGDAGNSAVNIINFTADANNYVQAGVMNTNPGNFASSDFVVTNDGSREGNMPIGTDTWYVDLGINSTSYTEGNSNILNNKNTGYLYSSSPADFYIGNGYPNKDLIFFANYGSLNQNNTADGYEIMRIKGGTNVATQQVTIGTPTPYLTNKLTVGGGIAATAFNNSSDRRLKTNIHSLNYGLKHVLALKPVSYNWINPNESKVKQLGLIAQDAKKIIPEIVSGDGKKENMAINYIELIPVLINAIKEQQKQIDELKQQVQKLQK